MRDTNNAGLTTANSHLDGLKGKLDALNDTSASTGTGLQNLANAVAALTSEMTAYRQTVEKQVLDAKAEMLKRIDNLPLEMTQDEDAYKLLKARLEKDLAESFVRRPD